MYSVCLTTRALIDQFLLLALKLYSKCSLRMRLASSASRLASSDFSGLKLGAMRNQQRHQRFTIERIKIGQRGRIHACSMPQNVAR